MTSSCSGGICLSFNSIREIVLVLRQPAGGVLTLSVSSYLLSAYELLAAFDVAGSLILRPSFVHPSLKDGG